MAYRLRQIVVTATGREITRDREVGSARITVGRAAENDIHLPDLALEPQHASLTLADGHITVAALGTLGFTLDGASAQSATIDTRSGGELGFGGWRIAVSQATDGAALLTIRRIAAGHEDDGAEKARFTLTPVMPSRRMIGWIATLFILALFLALPIATHLARAPLPAGHSSAAQLPRSTVIGDGSWNPGPLSRAHHALGDHCEACHVKAFVAVRDETCRACHADAHDHAPAARLAAARGWTSPSACTDCHVEHQGQAPMALPAQSGCGTCHGALRQRLQDKGLPETTLGDASDFSTNHPQFRAAIVSDPLTRHVTRVSLDAAPREASGLTFSHRVHLDTRGGVARMAATIGAEKGYSGGGGGASGLACKDCHRRSNDGVRFEPISMPRDCEACHSLAYDKVGGTFRQLHHGDVAQMVADLSAGDLHDPTLTNRVRPGDLGAGPFAAGGRYHASFGPIAAGGGASSLITQALSPTGVCGQCHTPITRNGKPGVMPVTLQNRYLPAGLFDHTAHRDIACQSCHAAGRSNSSADVLLPKIAQCRSCHAGEGSHSAKVPSPCVECHVYHPTPLVRGRARRDSPGERP